MPVCICLFRLPCPLAHNHMIACTFSFNFKWLLLPLNLIPVSYLHLLCLLRNHKLSGWPLYSEVRIVSILPCVINRTYQNTLNIVGTKATYAQKKKKKIQCNGLLTMVNDDIINLFTNSTILWGAHYVPGIVFHVIWNLAMTQILSRNLDFLTLYSVFWDLCCCYCQLLGSL